MYQQQKATERQVKVGDEADKLNERIKGEASATRCVLTTITWTTHPVSPSYSSNSNTSLLHRNGDSGWNNLEKIRIPTFSGSDGHLGGECPRSTVCNIDGCRDRHNCLLHGNQNGTKPQFCRLGSQPHGTQLQGTQSQGVQPQDTQSQETQPQANQPQPTQPQLIRTTRGRREVQFNRKDNTLAQETQGQGTGSMPSTEGGAYINSTTLKIQEKTQADTVALKHGKKKMLVSWMKVVTPYMLMKM